MNFNFKKLCLVNFRHPYHPNGQFKGFTVKPSEHTEHQMNRYGLLFNMQPDGFMIGYDAIFVSNERKQEDLLKDNTVLTFHLQLVDFALFNYTDLLPGNIAGKIFHFRNFNLPPEKIIEVTPGRLLTRDEEIKLAELAEIDEPASLTPRDNLQQDKFVSEKDIDNRKAFRNKYFSKPFAQVSLLLHSGLKENYTIQFAAKGTYWCYILLSAHVKELKNPAILNKSTKDVFAGPKLVTLPGNRKENAFVSNEPILLTSTPNRSFSLVENYEPGKDRHKVIISVLPNPDINHFSDIIMDKENATEENSMVKSDIIMVPENATEENSEVKKNYSNIII